MTSLTTGTVTNLNKEVHKGSQRWRPQGHINGGNGDLGTLCVKVHDSRSRAGFPDTAQR